MSTIITLAGACEGYACPPGNKVPAGDVIVRQVADTLATTGQDGSVFGFLAVAALLLIGGVTPYLISRRKRS
jgi:LPXTG-motif cell wall-anchored protein